MPDHRRASRFVTTQYTGVRFNRGPVSPDRLQTAMVRFAYSRRLCSGFFEANHFLSLLTQAVDTQVHLVTR